MTATVQTVTVYAVYGLFALGLVLMLWDAWRHDQDLKRRPGKRAVNQARLAQMHVIDRPVVVDRYANGSPKLERLPAGYRSPPDEDMIPGQTRLADGFWTQPDGRRWTGSEWR